MDREILFRAKAINRGQNISKRSHYKNGDWVYGLVTRLYDERFPNLPAEMTDINGISRIEVDYRTIGQFIGKFDIDKTKIFEGDIVRNEKDIRIQKNYEVRYLEKYSKFALCNRRVRFSFLAGHKVIGNVFDNPELLEV